MTRGRVDAWLAELTWRGLLHDHTPELPARLAKGPITAYVGFDPTAPSLQVGNLVPVMLLAHLQRHGGKPIVVLGGGTGMIGDPSGKRNERPLLELDQLAANVATQRAQFARFMSFGRGAGDAAMVNNADWLTKLDLVGFLRDIGKHFTIGYMLQKESVKSRIESGISFTEFTYMLLQAYDYLELFRRHGCELQMGGSDQWGNITAGMELIRRVEGGVAHALVAPLVATSSGAKFGKSEGQAIWLDAARTSPYQFYQFWINQDDEDIERYLGMFTFLGRDAIAVLMEGHAEARGARKPHRALARDLTERVHGKTAAEGAEQAAAIMFGDLDPRKASAGVWDALAGELPTATIAITAESLVVDVLVAAEVVKSKSEARRQIEQGGIAVNGAKVTDAAAAVGAPLTGGYYLVARGKKTFHLITPQ
ncbi:MAG: tyrosine--tRNA ligase [Gemmatimonadales bacterium]